MLRYICVFNVVDFIDSDKIFIVNNNRDVLDPAHCVRCSSHVEAADS